MLTGLALLNERIAEAVDAWLTDPQDAGVYGRLLAAVADRRAHLRGAASGTTAGEASVIVGGVPVAVDSIPDVGAADILDDAVDDITDVAAAGAVDDVDDAVDAVDDTPDDPHDGAVRAVGDLLDPTDVRAALARLRGVR